MMSQRLCLRNQQVWSSSLHAGSIKIKGLGHKSPGPFFYVQRVVPVGIVGGPDLSAIPNPPVMRSSATRFVPQDFPGPAARSIFCFLFQLVERI